MWKTPNKSPATTTGFTSTINSGRTQQHMQQQQLFQFPTPIIQNPQYHRLFSRIYKSQQKAYISINQEQSKNILNTIKQTITDKLKQQDKQKLFYKKFGKTISYSARKLIKKDHKSLLGLTKQQQNDEKLNSFLMDHKNAVQLQQQARLVQYYLRDQQKNKSNIQYLRRIQLTDKHRRTAPNVRDREQKIFNNSQLNYELLRKTAYIRNDKLMTMSIKNAKNNPTYLRMKNFAQIQFILNEDNQNLMISREIPKNAQKQRIFNMKIKLFVNLAIASDTLRAYYDYIREKQFPKLIELVLPQTQNQQQSTKVTAQYINKLINKIIKFKQNKVIHFQDFNEILQTVLQQRNYDILNKIQQSINNKNKNSKYYKLLNNKIDEFILKHKEGIIETIKNHKMQVITSKIYEQNKNKIIGRQYLPLRDILQIMKDLNIVPKIITMSKFMYTCLWYQTRREGFNREQFIKIQIAIGLQLNCTMEGLHSYFRSIKFQKILYS